MAVWRRQPKNTVMVHSDQGSQFSSYDWRDFLDAHNLQQSMSRRGNLRERLAFDSWGKRRTTDGSNTTPDTLDGVTDNRGFTGHEMLDQLDLVHMNGRVYDPYTGRFLSGDPILQEPMNGQSYNRYSYVQNNPTNLTDPTGFCADGSDKTVCKGMTMASQNFGDIGTLASKAWAAADKLIAQISGGKRGPDGGQQPSGKTGQTADNTGATSNTSSANNTPSGQAGGANDSDPNKVIVPGKRSVGTTQVFLVFTPLANGSTTTGHHTFLKVVSEDRKPFYIRAGPSKSGGMGVVTADTLGSADRTKDAGYGSLSVDFGE